MAIDRKDLGGASMVIASALSIQLGAALATTTFDTISPVSATGVSYAFAALVLLLVQPPIRIAAWDRQKWLDALAWGSPRPAPRPSSTSRSTGCRSAAR